jgi:hypothetical protein
MIMLLLSPSTASFPVPNLHHTDRGDQGLEKNTKKLRLRYNKKQFSTSGLSVRGKGSITNYDSIWRIGNPIKNLGGTVRTLDKIDGRTSLGPSLILHNGYGLIDDSKSILFTSEGWVSARKQQRTRLTSISSPMDILRCGDASILPTFPGINLYCLDGRSVISGVDSTCILIESI